MFCSKKRFYRGLKTFQVGTGKFPSSLMLLWELSRAFTAVSKVVSCTFFIRFSTWALDVFITYVAENVMFWSKVSANFHDSSHLMYKVQRHLSYDIVLKLRSWFINEKIRNDSLFGCVSERFTKTFSLRLVAEIWQASQVMVFQYFLAVENRVKRDLRDEIKNDLQNPT